jgi:hypothetical protein
MSNEDFHRIFLDFIQIEQQRYRNIMTSNQDVMDAIAANATAVTTLNTSINTAIADMGTGGDAARAAMVAALQAVATQLATAQTELQTAIDAQTAAASGTPVPAPVQ